MNTDYKVNLYLDDVLVGDVRHLAQNLTWSRARTNYGIDSINFTINDVLFDDWARTQGKSLEELLRPIALSCRIVRNNVEVAGGFLATLPAYRPNRASANLEMRFDGWLNLLEGIYIFPTATTTKRADLFVRDWITLANTRSSQAGKGYGFTLQSSQNLASIQRTYDNYKSVKEAITQMTDNVEGAGQFDVIFNPNKSYYISNNIGRWHYDDPLEYPTVIDQGGSVANITAPEVQGFASSVITLGAGEVSSDANKRTVITQQYKNSTAVRTYGYYERLTQYSSVSRQNTLNQHCRTDLHNFSKIEWLPQIQLLGIQIPPTNTADGIWIGDYFYINNTADATGMTSGWFRVQSFTVSVSATNAETITPQLERYASGQGESGGTDAQFNSALNKMTEEITDLKTTARRGLGMAQMYQATASVSIPARTQYQIDIEIYDDELTPALLQLTKPQYTEQEQREEDIVLDEGVYTYQKRTYTLTTALSGTYTLTSTARIKSFTITQGWS